MRRLSALVTILVLGFALAYGLNAALGEPKNDQPLAFVPIGTPGAQPSPPVGPPVDSAGSGDWNPPPVAGATSAELTDHVMVGGKTIALPPETLVLTGSRWPGPCSLEESEIVAQVQIPGKTAISWVSFTADGELLGKRVEPDVAPKLAALVAALPDTPRPTVGPHPNCVVMKGKVIWLPEGVLLGGAMGDYPVGVTPSGPAYVDVVTYNKSRIVFTRDGVLYEAQSVIAEEDQEALAPLLSELEAR